MIQDLVLRWFVTALFVISAAECVLAAVAGQRSVVRLVSQSLHFAMAAAMTVMAWPSGAMLPTTGPMIFFLAATAWFGVITVVESGHRLINAYHASMMLAMVWMYAVMGGSLIPTPVNGMSTSGGHGSHHGTSTSMPGMDMPAMADPTDSIQNPPLIGGLNWLFAVGFGIAAAWWIYHLVVTRRSCSTTSVGQHFGIACQSMMATGMAIMFAVMV